MHTPPIHKSPRTRSPQTRLPEAPYWPGDAQGPKVPLPAPWDDKDVSDHASVTDSDLKATISPFGVTPVWLLDFNPPDVFADAFASGFSRSSAGWAIDGTGTWASVASGSPRLMHDYSGTIVGLLFEPSRECRNNKSMDAENWGSLNGSVYARSSIFDGKDSALVDADSNSDGQIYSPSFSLSGGNEAWTFLLEESNAAESRFFGRNESQGNRMAVTVIDWSAMSVSEQDADHDSYIYDPGVNGPNGNPLALVRTLLDGATDYNSGGDNARLKFAPDALGNGERAYVHAVQREEAPTGSSFIDTGGSFVTRAADGYTIGTSNWWNGSGMTVLLEYRPRTFAFEAGTDLLQPQTSGATLIGHDGSGAVTADDGTNAPTQGSLSAFTTAKIAVSLTASEIRLSVNGASTVGSHNGNLLTQQDLALGGAGKMVGEVRSLAFLDSAQSAADLDTWTA